MRKRPPDVRKIWYICAYIMALGLFAFGIFLLHGFVPLSVAMGRSRTQRFAGPIIAGYLRGYLRLLACTGVLHCRWVDWPESMPDGPAVVVANHPSKLDAPLLLSRLPQSFCIFKKSLQHSMIFGDTAEAIGYISNAKGVDALRKAIAKVRRGNQFVIFPEGTRTEGAILPEQMFGSYATVAFHAEVPVYVFHITTNSDALTKGHRFWKIPTLPVRFTVRFVERLEPAGFEHGRALHQQVSSLITNVSRDESAHYTLSSTQS